MKERRIDDNAEVKAIYDDTHFQTDIDDNADFLPEETESNMCVLENANFSTASTPVDDDDRSDEIPSDLLIQDSIPEINEDDSTDDEIVKPLQFKKSHFKKGSSISSSSSDEDELSEGLQFPDHSAVDGNNQKPISVRFTDGFLRTLNEAYHKGIDLVPSLTGTPVSAPHTEIATDDESEFEIIGDSDLE